MIKCCKDNNYWDRVCKYDLDRYRHLLIGGSMSVDHKLELQRSTLHHQTMTINQEIMGLRQEVAGISASLTSQQGKDEAILSAVENTNEKISTLASHSVPHSHITALTAANRHWRRSSRTKVRLQLVPFGVSFENVVRYDEDMCDLDSITASRPMPRRCLKSKTILEIRVPFWYAEYQYTVCLRKALSGWVFLPRIFRDVPEYTPFLLACMNGPYKEVRRMLRSSTSMLYDRFNGMTGADVSIKSPGTCLTG